MIREKEADTSRKRKMLLRLQGVLLDIALLVVACVIGMQQTGVEQTWKGMFHHMEHTKHEHHHDPHTVEEHGSRRKKKKNIN